MKQLFDKSGGYRKLFSFSFATLIHLGTIRFCKRFISYKDDPLGKTVGQMVGAARSGRQNIIEGSERAATSKETEIKLTDVARASLAELLGDYEIYLAEKGEIPWSCLSDEHRAVSQANFARFEYTEDVLHDYWCYFQREKKRFAPWLESDSDAVMANALIILIQRTMAMLGGQLQHQGQAFLEEGGFRERMHECRTEQRDLAAADAAPACPGAASQWCGAPAARASTQASPSGVRGLSCVQGHAEDLRTQDARTQDAEGVRVLCPVS